jgi:hypothetical protein
LIPLDRVTVTVGPDELVPGRRMSRSRSSSVRPAAITRARAVRRTAARMRVVLDTNVLVSASIDARRRGPASRNAIIAYSSRI